MDVFRWLEPRSHAFDRQIEALSQQLGNRSARASNPELPRSPELIITELNRVAEKRSNLYEVANFLAQTIRDGKGPGPEGLAEAVHEFEGSQREPDEALFLLRARVDSGPGTKIKNAT